MFFCKIKINTGNVYKTGVVAVWCLFLSVFSATAQRSVETSTINSIYTAVPFLTIAPDTRSSGMGDVGAATTPDVNSLHWNPAKYAFIKNDESIALSYTPWLRGLGIGDMNLLYLTGYKRIEMSQVIAFSLRYFNMGFIDFRDDRGESLGPPRRPNEFAIDAAYSRMFSEKISAALAFRYVHSNIAAGFTTTQGQKPKTGNSFAADVAMFYNSEFHIADKSGDWALGINIANIGNKMSYSNEQFRMFIPTNLRIGGLFGINLDSHNKMNFAVDLNKLLVPTPFPPEYDENGNRIDNDPRELPVVQGMFRALYDAPDGFAEKLREITYGFGFEYIYREIFAVRTGYFHEDDTKGSRRYFSMGIGLSTPVIDIDVSYLIPRKRSQNSAFSNTLRFSLIYNFGKSVFRNS